MKQLTVLVLFFVFQMLSAQEIAILKYGGGGDWYANPTALPNLVQFCNEHINTVPIIIIAIGNGFRLGRR